MDMIVHNEKQQQIVTDDLQHDCMSRNCQKITFITSIYSFYDFLSCLGSFEIHLQDILRDFVVSEGRDVLRRVTQWILRLWLIVRAQVTIDDFFWRLFITWLIFDVKIIKMKINIDNCDTDKQYDMMVITIIINPLNSNNIHTHIACKSLIFLIRTWAVKVLQ